MIQHTEQREKREQFFFKKKKKRQKITTKTTTTIAIVLFPFHIRCPGPDSVVSIESTPPYSRMHVQISPEPGSPRNAGNKKTEMPYVRLEDGAGTFGAELHPKCNEIFGRTEAAFEKYLDERNSAVGSTKGNFINVVLNLMAKYRPESPLVKFMWDLPSLYLYIVTALWFLIWMM